jgi:hypothetical protein
MDFREFAVSDTETILVRPSRVLLVSDNKAGRARITTADGETFDVIGTVDAVARALENY